MLHQVVINSSTTCLSPSSGTFQVQNSLADARKGSQVAPPPRSAADGPAGTWQRRTCYKTTTTTMPPGWLALLWLQSLQLRCARASPGCRHRSLVYSQRGPETCTIRKNLSRSLITCVLGLASVHFHVAGVELAPVLRRVAVALSSARPASALMWGQRGMKA